MSLLDRRPPLVLADELGTTFDACGNTEAVAGFCSSDLSGRRELPETDTEDSDPGMEVDRVLGSYPAVVGSQSGPLLPLGRVKEDAMEECELCRLCPRKASIEESWPLCSCLRLIGLTGAIFPLCEIELTPAVWLDELIPDKRATYGSYILTTPSTVN